MGHVPAEAIEQAVRYGAYSRRAVERILAVQASPETALDQLAEKEQQQLKSLLNDLAASLAADGAPQRIRYYARFDLLVIDGFGFDKLEREKTPQALSPLYKLIDKRNNYRSTALATNLDFDEWPGYLSDPVLTMALLDRLVDRMILMKINGKSCRAYRGQQTTAKACQRRAERKSLKAK